jgi:fumarylacetoacetate (FAA) hydrolase family protein/predicted MFS family arabinose efflux permease
MHIVRYAESGQRAAMIGIRDEAGLHPLEEQSLGALLSRSAERIREIAEAAASVPAVTHMVTLLPPVDGRMEVWAAGVTYVRSRDARLEESGGADIYDLVYDAERPELFFKSVAWRAVTTGQPIAIRRDSSLDVPEAELAIVVNAAGTIIGYTVCDDVSSRSIEGENPLYLPQAKIYDGACALAPAIRPAWEVSADDLAITVDVHRDGSTAWAGRTSTSQIHRPLDQLVRFLFAEQSFPHGAIISTGTGIVPELGFTLQDGDTVTIDIDQVGTLVNAVVAHDRALSGAQLTARTSSSVHREAWGSAGETRRCAERQRRDGSHVSGTEKPSSAAGSQQQADDCPAAPVRLGSPPGVVRVISFLWGLQNAFLTPALALLLVSVFGASTGQVSVVLAIYNSAGMLSAWVIPRWADRRRDYVRPMIGCAVFTLALSISLWSTHTLIPAVAALVVLGAPAVVGSPLLFGYIRHCGATPRDLVQTRAMFSIAWVIGPALASGIISAAGGHALVLSVGAVGLINIFAISTLLRRKNMPPVDAVSEAAVRQALVSRRTLLLVVAAVIALQAACSTSVATITLFVTRELYQSPLWGGIALGVAAGLEVPVLLLLGSRRRRISDLGVLSIASVIGIAYYLLMSMATSGVMVIALQVINAAFVGVLAGTTVTLFQSIMSGPGAAAGLQANAMRAGAMLAGPLVGVGTIFPGGLRAVYVACAVSVTVGLLLILVVRRRMRALPARPPDAHRE